MIYARLEGKMKAVREVLVYAALILALTLAARWMEGASIGRMDSGVPHSQRCSESSSRRPAGRRTSDSRTPLHGTMGPTSKLPNRPPRRSHRLICVPPTGCEGDMTVTSHERKGLGITFFLTRRSP